MVCAGVEGSCVVMVTNSTEWRSSGSEGGSDGDGGGGFLALACHSAGIFVCRQLP